MWPEEKSEHNTCKEANHAAQICPGASVSSPGMWELSLVSTSERCNDYMS